MYGAGQHQFVAVGESWEEGRILPSRSSLFYRLPAIPWYRLRIYIIKIGTTRPVKGSLD